MAWAAAGQETATGTSRAARPTHEDGRLTATPAPLCTKEPAARPKALVDPVLSFLESKAHRREDRTPVQTVHADFPHTAYR